MWRLWARVDVAFVLTTLAVTALIALAPTADLLVRGLEPTVEGGGFEAVSGQRLDAEWRVGTLAGVPVAWGTDGPDPGTYVPSRIYVGLPGFDAAAGLQAPASLPPSHAWIHPDDAPTWTHSIVATREAARANDAFEVDALAKVQGLLLGLVFAMAIPIAAVLLASLRLERTRQARTLELFERHGRRNLFLGILYGRSLVAQAIGVAVSAAVALWLYRNVDAFQPASAEPLRLIYLVLAPLVLANGAALLLFALPEQRWAPRFRTPWIPGTMLGRRAIGPSLGIAALLLTTVLAPLALIDAPQRVLDETDAFVLGPEGDDPFTGRLDVRRLDAKLVLDEIPFGVGEVLLPTTLNGEAFLLRGSLWSQASAFHGVELVAGTTRGLVLGDQAAQDRGLAIGDAVWVQSRAGVPTQLFVSGILSGPGVFQDEGWVPRTLGQTLAGMTEDQVSVVRYAPRTGAVQAAYESDRVGVQILRIEVPSSVVRGEPFNVTVHAVNTGAQSATASFPLRLDGITVDRIAFNLAPFEREAQTVEVVANRDGARIDVNPTATILSNPDALPVRLENQTLLLGEGTYQLQAPNDSQTLNGPTQVELTDPGAYILTQGNGLANLYVATTNQILGAWFETSAPLPGQAVTLFVQLAVAEPGNLTVGDQGVPVSTEGGSLQLIQRAITYQGPVDLTFGDDEETVGAAVPPRPQTLPRPEAPSQRLEQAAADRVLGETSQSLGLLAGLSLLVIIINQSLTASRILEERRHLLRSIRSSGVQPLHIATRLGWEVGLWNLFAALVILALSFLLFPLLGALTGPTIFGHRIGAVGNLQIVLPLLVLLSFPAGLVMYFQGLRALKPRRTP